MDSAISKNPLATEKISRLILKFAIPAIISGLVGALYNIVDQIFIGQTIGYLGNAATNVTFPFVTFTTAVSLMLGVGSASNFSLHQGRGDTEKAAHTAGTGITSMVVGGILMAIVFLTFLDPLLKLFGAGPEFFDYAHTYARITSLGVPFLLVTTAGGLLVRADGSPTYAMASTLSGAALNVILDYLFMFPLDMGIAGAAWATVIGQVVSGVIILFYFTKFRSLDLRKRHFRPQLQRLKSIIALGMAVLFNNLSIMLVQITMNNTLALYGEQSIYGRDIPIAVAGITTKVNFIFISIMVGIAQGCQPIFGFNYGAKNYQRVKETYKKAALAAVCVGCVAFTSFQFFPRQIISVFGSGSEEYFHFAERFFRIYMFMTFINGIQPLTANFFSAIGKAHMGMITALTRQCLFLIPLIIILPRYLGIDGIMYAGPISDVVAFVTISILISWQMRSMSKMEAKKTYNEATTPISE